jgi:hypothetical protein
MNIALALAVIAFGAAAVMAAIKGAWPIALIAAGLAIITFASTGWLH